jgi:hypothetical protein
MISKLFFTLLLPTVLVSAQKVAGPSPAEVNGQQEPPKDQGGIFGGNMLRTLNAPRTGEVSGSALASMLSGGKAGGGIMSASKSYTYLNEIPRTF